MKAEVKANNAVHVTGYVNVVGRESLTLQDAYGEYIEIVHPGAFQRALQQSPDVKIKLNHKRYLGSITDGNLKLKEDAVGLYADAMIDDPEVRKEADQGNLIGWSFGFIKPDQKYSKNEDGKRVRHLYGMVLTEVTIVTRAKKPCYPATSMEVRASGESEVEYRTFIFDKTAYAIKLKQLEILEKEGEN